MIGSLDSNYKGLDIALQALATIKSTIPEFEFRVLGSGMSSKWQKLVDELQLKDNVVFCGTMPAEEVFDWLKDIDIYLQPSRTEGQGRSVIEAMAMGCPAITSNVGGMKELTDDRMRFPNGDEQELAKIIQLLLENNVIYQQQIVRNYQAAMDFSKEILEEKRKYIIKNLWIGLKKMKKDNLKLGVLGLGYVGLPVAVAFGKKMPVMGLDVNQKRIEQLKHTHDETGEVTDEDLLSTNIDFTSDAKRLKECNFIIVAVPTPINESNQPDMRILHKASKMIGQNIQKGTTVVFESTVYPGATEEECAPIIEQWSGLVSGKDFFIGYSPERINPGDKTHTFTTILKIVSGQNEQTTERVADVYSSVVTAGVFKASSIKVAEAAKVIENTQRDLNIALMNELSQIFHELNIDTQEVLEAAGTKWNFLKFEPGLVGGHCIGVDPYYLAHKAESVGYHPEVILAGRRVNDSMAQYVGQSIVKELLKQKKHLGCLKVSVLGLTLKKMYQIFVIQKWRT